MGINTNSFVLGRAEIDVAYFTDKGSYAINEDSMSVYFDEKNKIVGCCLADGLGGHSDGSVASGTAVKTFEEFCNSGISNTNKWISDTVMDANRAVLEKKIDGKEMYTTFTLMVIRKSDAKFTSIGDTRCYFFCDGEYIRTKDHSITQIELDHGNITEEQVRFHEDRSSLTRVLGDEKLKIPEVQNIKLKKDSAFMLCSDGFWEYVREKEMLNELHKSKSSEEWLAGMMKILEKNQEQTCDNRTAICGKVKKLPGFLLF